MIEDHRDWKGVNFQVFLESAHPAFLTTSYFCLIEGNDRWSRSGWWWWSKPRRIPKNHEKNFTVLTILKNVHLSSISSTKWNIKWYPENMYTCSFLLLSYTVWGCSYKKSENIYSTWVLCYNKSLTVRDFFPHFKKISAFNSSK